MIFTKNLLPECAIVGDFDFLFLSKASEIVQILHKNCPNLTKINLNWHYTVISLDMAD